MTWAVREGRPRSRDADATAGAASGARWKSDGAVLEPYRKQGAFRASLTRVGGGGLETFSST